MSCPWWLAQKAKADWTGVLTHHSSNARHRSDPDSPVTDECRDDHRTAIMLSRVSLDINSISGSPLTHSPATWTPNKSRQSPVDSGRGSHSRQPMHEPVRRSHRHRESAGTRTEDKAQGTGLRDHDLHRTPTHILIRTPTPTLTTLPTPFPTQRRSLPFPEREIYIVAG